MKAVTNPREPEGRLSRRAESLIGKWYDGEAGFLGRRVARRLVESDERAAEFHTALGRVTSAVRTAGGARGEPVVDLWSAIERGIDREEAAGRALEGRRPSPTGPFESLFDRPWAARFGWGASGAFAAATVLVVAGAGRGAGPLSGGTSAGPASAGAAMGTSSGPGAVSAPAVVSTVAYGGGRSESRRAREPFEIDWMRAGSGSARLIGRAGEKSSVIWITRGNDANEDYDYKTVPQSGRNVSRRGGRAAARGAGR